MDEIHFAQIREDGRLERTLVERRKLGRIVCVGSGGCTALSLLSRDVDTVYCVDKSPAQSALVELKRAALSALDRSAFLAFIGERDESDRGATYRRLAPLLPAYAREFWDARPGAVSLGINRCGTTERFYRFVGDNLTRSVRSEEIFRALFGCRSIAEQNEHFERHFSDESWRTALSVLLSKTTHLAFFPSFMFAQATEHDFGSFFLGQFELEVRNKPLKDNYFLSQILFGSYVDGEPEGSPRYLGDEGYEEARRFADKLAIVPRSLEAFLLEEGGIDAFFLSNVFDWMSEPDRARLCELVLRAASPRATILWRNMLSAHPLPTFFARRFARNDELSAELVDLERSMMYRRISAGELS
jgi:S-adenosylmethionine:diacylglycerol 3-amino-3-carboxypropyl transferase